jgi:sterol 3beta-glucosyltransferase
LRGALTNPVGPPQRGPGGLAPAPAPRPLFARMLESAWQGCQGSDALIVTLPTTWGDQIADALGIPCAWALMQPLGRTAAFPSPLQPFNLPLGRAYNRLTHTITEQIVWQPWRDILGRWRRERLRLPSLKSIGWAARTAARGDLFLFGFSPQVVARPPDWPDRYHITGYWLLEPADGWAPAPALREFLAAHPAPLYVGFGSTGAERDQTFMERVLRAIALSGQRCILQAGARADTTAALSPQIYALESAPHSWLFPRMVAAVHHGGQGTAAAALRAGIPSVCVPFGADQFFWGRRLALLRAGPQPIPRHALTAQSLAQAIDAVVHQPIFKARAAQLGEQIEAEQGVERAAALIDAHLRSAA